MALELGLLLLFPLVPPLPALACILVNDLKLTQTFGLRQTPKCLAESFLENATINTQAITRLSGKAIFDDQIEIKSCKAGRIIALQVKK